MCLLQIHPTCKDQCFHLYDVDNLLQVSEFDSVIITWNRVGKECIDLNLHAKVCRLLLGCYWLEVMQWQNLTHWHRTKGPTP